MAYLSSSIWASPTQTLLNTVSVVVRRMLVIWRNLKDKTNKGLDGFFRKQEYNPKDMEFDLIYVKGDNNFKNLRRDDETCKGRLIEEDFKRLMFVTCRTFDFKKGRL